MCQILIKQSSQANPSPPSLVCYQPLDTPAGAAVVGEPGAPGRNAPVWVPRLLCTPRPH